MTSETLLISDLDDTLVGDDAALERFCEYYDRRKHELKLVYATGREFESVVEEVRGTSLPAPAAVICDVGSEIREFDEGTRLDSWPKREADDWSAAKVRECLSEEPDLELQPEKAQSEYKVSYYLTDATPKRLDELKESLANAGIQSDIIYSSQRDLDFLPAGVNKGSAARFLARKMQFDLDHVIVAGNSLNDAKLLEIGAKGIVVSNAHEDLKRELEHTPRVYFAKFGFADGVREGLENFLREGETK